MAPEEYGDLKHSGGINGVKGAKLSRRQSKLNERKSYVEVHAGPGTNAQAVQDEFGNSRQAPTPYVRPAWEETKDQALEIVVDELGSRIMKAAKAAGRKRERAARKA